jgi:aspartate carbamoyltransferase catalytic subunit
MSNCFYQQDIVTVQDFSRDEIELILDTAERLKRSPIYHLLKDKVIATCFFEASTRTRLSFESAVYKLGGNIIGFADSGNTSLGKKGESLEDTIRMIECYSDAIIIRHPDIGSAQIAADISSKPVINAGDGANQHPTQTLLDLFTIREHFKKIDGLKIAMLGDLKYGRTVHSLAKALVHYDVELILCPQTGFEMPESICDILDQHKISYSVMRDLPKVLQSANVIYMTRCQKERLLENENVVNKIILTADLLERFALPDACVMHPLPRVDEIDISVDNTKFARYFQQAGNGLYVRQAILKLLLCK